MAAIQKLRNKSGLLTIVIGIALLTFIVTGLGKQLFSSRGQNVIAEINGKEYPYDAYGQVLDTYLQGQQNQSETQTARAYENAWNAFVNKAIFDETFIDLGLGVYNSNLNIVGVTSEELKDMVVGENIDPNIRQAFTNPQTQQFDKQQLISYIQNIPSFKESNPQAYMQWVNFEKGLHETKLQQKYSNLITKGYYPTSLEIEMAVEDQTKLSSIDYIKIPYSSFQDSTMTVSDDEIAKYYEEHKAEDKYKQEASVTFEYVTFDITPTIEDIQEVKAEVASKKDAFHKAENTQAFLRIGSDIPYNPTFYYEGQLSPQIDSIAFNSKVGTVTDVYQENNMFKIAKVTDIRMGCDSASVRHILFSKDDPSRYYLADSLKKRLEADSANFDELVMKYSADPGSKQNGGKYEWFGKSDMVTPFRDSSFFGEVGKYYLCESQFGVHLIEVLEQSPKTRKYVQVEYFAKEITYSKDTRTQVRKEANAFASENQTVENFNKAIEENNALTKKIAEKTTENQRAIPGLSDSRQIIKWAHTNKESIGEISDEVFTCGDSYVVAMVTKVNEEGPKDLEDVKEEIRNILLEEKAKAKILEKANTIQNKTIESIAKEFNTRPLKSSNISFSMQSAPNLGMEPKVIATASMLEVGTLSNAIEGTQGVFFIIVTDKKDADGIVADNILMQKTNILKRSIESNMYKYLQEKSDIVDNRIQFQ